MPKDTRQDTHPRPSGEEVEFYLGASAQYRKGESIPIKVNDYVYEARVGQRNKLPKEVLQVLQNARSQTSVPDLERYDPTRRGVPRKQDDFFNPEKEIVYQSDFDIEILK